METSKMEVRKEVRFAVVMYGGVSLAIYINGVAQELLKMCRATDGKRKYEDLRADEKVYRQIAFLLADESRLNFFAEHIAAADIPDDAERAKEQSKRECQMRKDFDEFIRN